MTVHSPLRDGRLRCHGCGQQVSNVQVFPSEADHPDVVFRCWISCPECLERTAEVDPPEARADDGDRCPKCGDAVTLVNVQEVPPKVPGLSKWGPRTLVGEAVFCRSCWTLLPTGEGGSETVLLSEGGPS